MMSLERYNLLKFLPKLKCIINLHHELFQGMVPFQEGNEVGGLEGGSMKHLISKISLSH